VYWDGRVSACCCCDYDAARELALGSVREHTLTDIYNGTANRHLWAHQESGNMQGICRNCTFHVPISELNERRPFGARWLDFSGG
jgi:radical SAM protein with 4Fe4S-binding SPASM domain